MQKQTAVAVYLKNKQLLEKLAVTSVLYVSVVRRQTAITA